MEENQSKEYKLTSFQQWVLLYFLKNKEGLVKDEDLVENMCLTATLDFDINNYQKELWDLKNKKLIEEPNRNMTTELNNQYVQNIDRRTGRPIIPIRNIDFHDFDKTNVGNSEPRYYTGTLAGRFYVKQKILMPLIKAKKEDKIAELIQYLNSKHPNNSLVEEIHRALNEPTQENFLKRITDLALNKMVPFLSILNTILKYFDSAN